MDLTHEFDNIEAENFAEQILLNHLEGMNFEEAITWLREVVEYGCVSGIVTEVIYTRDIHQIFKDNLNKCLSLMADFAEINGSLSFNEHQIIDFPQTAVWSLIEHTAAKFLDKLLGDD